MVLPLARFASLPLSVCSFALLTLCSVALAQAPSAPLGTNLTAVNDYSPQLPFIDMFKISREWFTQCDVGDDPGCTNGNAWDTGEAASLDLDGSGWVRSLPSRAAAPVFTSAATFWDIPAQFPRGTYIVLYDGTGSIEYGLGARKESARSQPGRDVISIDPANGGILLRITATDPGVRGDYIRNIRLVTERDESIVTTQTFSTAFLNQLRPYRALRFMDWMQTNNSSVSSWSARAHPSDARYSTARGVPVEVMVQLANTTGATPWFTMPHQADNAFVQAFAESTKAALSPGLPVYVEYSNEVWNDVFAQGAWVQAQGEAAWPSANASGFTKRINFYGRRAAEVCAIWRAVFSDAPARVVCVTASQAANSWTASEALACPLWDQAPCVNHGIRALAIAPYFGDYIGGNEHVARVASWTGESDGGLASLFRELTRGAELPGGPPGGAMPQSFGWMSDNRSVAEQHGLELVAYEGGQHLVGVGAASNNASITRLFTAANRDARMESLYSEYLSGWNTRGGELFMHFTDIGSYSVYGSWGALEEVGQSTTPKYSALYRYALGTAPPVREHLLTVHRVGRGTIRGSAGGISCGSTCAASLTESTKVTLSAKALQGARFKGWSGACRHSRTRCVVTMSGTKRVRGVFVGRSVVRARSF